jgi:hypothetical protein
VLIPSSINKYFQKYRKRRFSLKWYIKRSKKGQVKVKQKRQDISNFVRFALFDHNYSYTNNVCIYFKQKKKYYKKRYYTTTKIKFIYKINTIMFATWFCYKKKFKFTYNKFLFKLKYRYLSKINNNMLNVCIKCTKLTKFKKFKIQTY